MPLPQRGHRKMPVSENVSGGVCLGRWRLMVFSSTLICCAFSHRSGLTMDSCSPWKRACLRRGCCEGSRSLYETSSKVVKPAYTGLLMILITEGKSQDEPPRVLYPRSLR